MACADGLCREAQFRDTGKEAAGEVGSVVSRYSRLTSKYLRPVSSYRYCILPSVIMTGSLYQARIAARQERLSEHPLLKLKRQFMPSLTWIQVLFAKFDDFLLGWPSILHRHMVKRWKVWLSHVPRCKRSLRTLLQVSHVSLCSNGIAKRSSDAAHGFTSDTPLC